MLAVSSPSLLWGPFGVLLAAPLLVARTGPLLDGRVKSCLLAV